MARRAQSRAQCCETAAIGWFARRFAKSGRSRVFATECETVCEAQEVTRQVPVWETEQRERRYKVLRAVHETSMREERYCVQRPVHETVMRDCSYDVVRNVVETHEREERYMVSRPVTETQMREERFCVQRPVCETVHQPQCRTVMRPVTTCRTECVDQGCWRQWYAAGCVAAWPGRKCRPLPAWLVQRAAWPAVAVAVGGAARVAAESGAAPGSASAVIVRSK